MSSAQVSIAMNDKVVTAPSLSPRTSLTDRPDFLPVSPKHSPAHHCRRHSSSSTTITSGSGKNSHPSSDSPTSDGLDQGYAGSGMRSNSSTSTISGRSRSSNNSSTDLISPNDQTNSHDHGKDTVDDGKVITPPENAPDKSPDNSSDGHDGDSCKPVALPNNALVKMYSNHRLQVLLTQIAAKDPFYSGLEEVTPGSQPASGDWSSGQGPSSFSPLEGTPNSHPPSLKLVKPPSVDSPFYHFCNTVFKDGPGGKPDGAAAAASPQKQGGVWTLNLLDGSLFLFKTNPRSEGEGEGEREDLVDGIELSKLLEKQTPTSAARNADYYFHHPYTVLNAEVENPHMSPVYTPPRGSKYRLYRRHDSKMTPTEFMLHHGAVFLVLQENGEKPVINAIIEEDMIATLEKLATEGKTFPNPVCNPVVNIKFGGNDDKSDSESDSNNPNNVAIYFTGQKYRYYVHVKDDHSLSPVAKPLPIHDENNFMGHLQFNYDYNPQGIDMMSSGVGGAGPDGTAV